LKSFVMADIPGLIEGAHEGKGLGLQFLRHIERNRIILYLIDPEDPETEDPLKTFRTLQRELEKYSSKLAEKPAAVVLTKKDTWQETDWLKKLPGKFPFPTLAISAVTGDGLGGLKQHIWSQLEKVMEEEKENSGRIV